MPTLKRILEIHDQHTGPGSLPDSLGDGFLLATNPIARNIRAACTGFGYSFTNRRFHSYDIMPLVVLPVILREKVIPYRDNVEVLRGIEASSPGVFGFDEVPLSQQSANLILHESAHCVAHEVIRTRPLEVTRFPGVPDFFRERSAALDLLTGEAFANACELLGNLALKTQEMRRIYSQSSYLFMAEGDRPGFLRALELFGFDGTFKAVVFSYLYSNFLFRSETQCDLEGFAREILGRARLSEQERTALQEISAPAFALDPAFRLCTASFYFRMLGYTLPLEEAVNFNFARAFFEIPALRARLSELVRIAEQGPAHR